MTTTVGQPEHRTYGDDWRHPTANPWAQEAVAARGYSDFEPAQPEPDEDGEPVEPTRTLPAGGNRSPRTVDLVRSVIADAQGIDLADLDEDIDVPTAYDIMANDLTEADARAALDALDRALADPRMREARAPRGESDGAYVAREGNWRERHNLPRRRKSVPPSRTPEARRVAHIAKKAARLGISVVEAERVTPRRRPRKTPVAVGLAGPVVADV
jgi:hypothetical protein